MLPHPSCVCTEKTARSRRRVRSATRLLSVVALTCVVAAATPGAHGWHFDCRFIERIGNTNVELPGNVIDASNGSPRNIRVQFGVFDDADGPAPSGGFVGWNVGTLAVSGPAGNSDERRNNGRISPYNFAAQSGSNGNPPLPGGDPFTMLTEIDATLGTQSPVWTCWDPDGDGMGEPTPMPVPTIRGWNTFVSVFAFRIDPQIDAVSYEVSAGGNLIAATEWLVVGSATPPDCGDISDPACNIPGSVTYAPFPTQPQLFSSTLTVVVPSSTAGACAGIAGALALVRRQRRGGSLPARPLPLAQPMRAACVPARRPELHS